MRKRDNVPRVGPESPPRIRRWLPALNVELEFDGVSSINNYSMRKVQRNTARNRQHMGVHRNTYRFCGKPIGCVAKNRCARKT